MPERSLPSSGAGVNFDNNTIVQLPDGVYGLPRPQKTVYGDFENNDSGAFTLTTSSSTLGANGGLNIRSMTGSEDHNLSDPHGTYYARLNVGDSGTADGSDTGTYACEREVDVTDADVLRMRLKATQDGTPDVMEIRLGGNVIFSGTTSESEFEHDVSDLTGTKTLEFYIEDNSIDTGNRHNLIFDNIRVKELDPAKASARRTINYDQEGGHVE